MSELKNLKKIEETNEVVALQNFSQCAFDILQIVKTVIKYPGEYKELSQKYVYLVNSLPELEIPDHGIPFRDEGYILPLDFIYLPYREEEDKKVLYKAEDNLRYLVSRVEQKRAELLGDKYKPHTGIKDLELKEMLEKISGKNSQPFMESTEDHAINFQHEDEDEIKISESVTKLYKDFKFEARDKKGRVKFKKNGKWVDLGGYNTRTYKLAKYIFMPSSKSILVDDVFEYIKIPKDDNNEELQKNTPRAYQLKREKIQQGVDELQKAKFLKGHLNKPVFNDKDKKVIIKIK